MSGDKGFGGKVRIRVCGICIVDDKILLARHQGLGETGTFWVPPGGGVEFGESLEKALSREYLEETGLKVAVGEFLFMHEFLGGHFHALELFFKVSKKSGTLQVGYDPELKPEDQMLKELKFFSETQLGEIPENQKHQIFENAIDFKALLALRGYFRSEILL